MKPKSLNKAFAVLLSFMLIVTLLPTTVYAAGMPEYSGGTGTKEDPWLISSVDDLKTLANTINTGKAADFDADAAAGGSGVAGNYYGYYFKQTCDLDLSAIADWEPIGYSGDYYFAGNYDGGNYTIFNMTSTGKNDEEGYATAGLFGWVAFGSVSNVHVKHANLKATGQGNYSYAGGITGVVYGSSITNCSVSDSVIESARDSNNNCAGGITGYSSGGTFDRCAAEVNTIKTMAYGGGFVGEVDDDYGAGTSSFKNCYAANSSVTAFTEEAQGLSFAGEFAGEMTASALTLENCFVYNNTAAIGEGSAPPYLKKTGVFAANLWRNETMTPIHATNCYYYTKEELPVNTGDAEVKSVDKFADGTVTTLLGTAFVDGVEHPVIGSFPADYTKVNAAIEKVGALNKEEYKDFSNVEAAINAVVRDKIITEQTVVDSYAEAIENAINALVYKDADYTRVDEAIAKAKALNKDDYKDFSPVEAAINAVVHDKIITEQAVVDSYAEAIENAINALVYKDADYTKVDEAIAKAKALNKDDYKDFSPVEAAINAVVRGKDITEQDKVDDMALAIENAIANLKKKPATETPSNTDTPTGGDQTGGNQTGGNQTSSDQTGGNQTGHTTSPETGDNNNIALWFAVMLVAGTALTGTVLYNCKRKYNR